MCVDKIPVVNLIAFIAVTIIIHLNVWGFVMSVSDVFWVAIAICYDSYMVTCVAIF